MNQKFKQTEIGKFLSPAEQVADLTGKVPATSKKGLGERLGENQINTLDIILENKHISAKELPEKIGISTTAVENNIAKLKAKEFLKRVGPDKGEYWEIKENIANDKINKNV